MTADESAERAQIIKHLEAELEVRADGFRGETLYLATSGIQACLAALRAAEQPAPEKGETPACCPTCGRAPDISECSVGLGWHVGCYNSGRTPQDEHYIGVNGDTKEEAIAFWNLKVSRLGRQPSHPADAGHDHD